MRILPLVLICGVAFAQAPSPEFANLAQQAVTAQQNGDSTHAAELYRQLLQMDPNQVVTHVNLAVALVALGQFDEAIREYQAADQLLPGDPRIQKNLALAYEKSGRVSQARTIFEQLHTASPADTSTTLLLADCELQAGDDAAVVSLLQPIATDVGDDRGFDYMLGMALLHEHRPDDAQIYLDRILKNGDTAEARFLLGTRMFEANDYPAAVKQFASAIALNPALRQLQSFYGQSLLRTGDPDGAREAFERALTADPNDFEANLGLAQIGAERKQFGDALTPAKRAAGLRRQNGAANLVVAQCLAGVREFTAALPYGEAATRALPHSAEAHQTLAEIYTGLHDTSRAETEIASAKRLESELLASDPGPKIHDEAPDFTLPRAGSLQTLSLHEYRGKQPVVLVFGSYTCPNFRDSAESLKALQRRYGARVEFLLVYIREAHDTGSWQSTRNSRSDVQLAPARNMTDKEDHAAMCSRKLHLPFPAVVDRMDDATESAYNAWPSRMFVVDSNGRIAYSTRLTEMDFHPADMEKVLETLR